MSKSTEKGNIEKFGTLFSHFPGEYSKGTYEENLKRHEKAIEIIEAYKESHAVLRDLFEDIIPNNQKLEDHILKVSLYVSDEVNAEECQKNLEKIINSFSSAITLAGFPIKGSWFRRFKFITESDGVKEKISQLEHAAKLATIEKMQSEINHKNSEALSVFLSSIDKNENAVALIGSLLVVKNKIQGKSNLVVRTLSETQMRKLDDSPGLLQDPNEILNVLGIPHIDTTHEKNNSIESDQRNIS